jgi:hypothetical protein
LHENFTYTHPLTGLDGWADILNAHAGELPADFALSCRSEFGAFTPLLAEQLHCYAKAKTKLPQLHEAGWLYDKTALEQSSGQAAAAYKAGLVSGRRMADLTGGLGIDTLFMSRRFEQVHHVEQNERISFLARHNYAIARAGGTAGTGLRHHHRSAEVFLEQLEEASERLDLIYIDPSRRQGGQRVFQLADCAPDVPALLPQLERCADAIMLKLSPMYDLKQLSRELPQVQWIQIVSVGGEVKELLCGWEHRTGPDGITPEKTAVLLDDAGVPTRRLETGASDPSPERGLHLEELQQLDEPILAVPDAAVIKAGGSSEAAQESGLQRISRQHDYLIGAGGKVPTNFPGTLYKVERVMAYQPKKLKTFFKQQGISRVHIHKRQFDVAVDALYRKFGLQMGEQAHAFFTKDAGGRPCCLIAQKLDI